jgi:hypothetical protein
MLAAPLGARREPWYYDNISSYHNHGGIMAQFSANQDVRLQPLDKQRSWHGDVAVFDAMHRGHPFRSIEPLYALPSDLLKSIQNFVPKWLSAAEIAFEETLANLVARHYSFGMFCGMPVKSFLLNRTPKPIISEDQFRLAGWDRYNMTLEDVLRAVPLADERFDPIYEQLQAYVGWLLTNQQFLAERDRLRSRWEQLVMGSIPAYPVRIADEPDEPQSMPPPQGGKDVTKNMVSEFNAFYERWQIRRLVTWDLPEPFEVNLSGCPTPGGCQPENSKFGFDLTPILRLPARYPLQQILADIQHQETPEHLRPWLDAQDRMHDDGLRHGRFGHFFEIVFFRDTVLASRYQDRFSGHVELLDYAFADFLGFGSDSVKKLRLKANALRSSRP